MTLTGAGLVDHLSADGDTREDTRDSGWRENRHRDTDKVSRLSGCRYSHSLLSAGRIAQWLVVSPGDCGWRGCGDRDTDE